MKEAASGRRMARLMQKVAKAYKRAGGLTFSTKTKISWEKQKEKETEEDWEEEEEEEDHHHHHQKTIDSEVSTSLAPSTIDQNNAASSGRNLCRDVMVREDTENSLPKIRAMETLLSQLFSSISALKSTYGQLQAALNRPYDDAQRIEVADKAVMEELQRLSDLQDLMVVAQYEDERDHRQHTTFPQEEDFKASVHELKKDAILQSYEGIITSFHSEIWKKDAQVEALKDALARSMLKGEKLERQLKGLQVISLAGI